MDRWDDPHMGFRPLYRSQGHAAEGYTMSTNTAQQIVEHEPEQSRAIAVVTPMEMLHRALELGQTPEVLGKLMDLSERWERNQGRKAYDAAMSAAKSEIPIIGKNRVVDFTSAKGRTHYRYEDLAEVARTVNPVLARHGLSYRFRTTSPPNEPVTVTCIISHRDGYAEENTLSAGRDDSGNKNSIQAVGSTLTYLQRMTLKAALGLAASDDDDGKSSDTEGPLSDAQAEIITNLVAETKTKVDLFLKWAGAESISDIPASRFEEARKMLEAKKAKPV